jgi:hypothetical protein
VGIGDPLGKEIPELTLLSRLAQMDKVQLSTSAGLDAAANALRNVPGSIYTWQSTRPNDKQVETTLFQAGAVATYGLNRASQGARLSWVWQGMQSTKRGEGSSTSSPSNGYSVEFQALV